MEKLRFFGSNSGFFPIIISLLLLFCYISSSFSNAQMALKIFEKAMPENTPLPQKPHRKNFDPSMAPAQPPYYGDFYSSTSPNLSDCCGPNTVLRRNSEGCDCVYPIKLEILLSNVSPNADWKLFLVQFASQLSLRVSQIELVDFYVVGPTKLNVSMDIAPRRGVSFPQSQADAIKSPLSAHKVRFDPSLVGDYHLLNFTVFWPTLASPAPSSLISPTVSQKTPVDSKGPIVIVVLGALILVIVSIFLAVVCFCVFRSKKRVRTVEKQEIKQGTNERIPTEESLRRPTTTNFLPYEDLKSATNNFQPSNIIGEGGFGKVFKGVLPDGTNVAVKMLTGSGRGQREDRELLAEVEILGRLHHRNIVKLVGYYSNGDSSVNLLCYELVPNGNLESWLHGALGASRPLDWEKRMRIALDAARGLAYMHEDCQPCVIHRDFKASNILLGNDFHAKVSDFGLAKQAPPQGRADRLSTRVMGTFGYVAPEYAMTGHLLVKSDVYSYGVVLLELLTGRRPVDMNQPSGQENLVAWARPILRDTARLEEIADSRLERKYPKEDFLRVCTVAEACVAPEAHQRPTMGEVVQSLTMLVQRFPTEHKDHRFTVRKTTSNCYNNNDAANLRQTSEHENFLRSVALSEDLQEGR